VSAIHNYGGSLLGADRGGDNVDMVVSRAPPPHHHTHSEERQLPLTPLTRLPQMRFLSHTGVNQLYIIGGDGTHRGADAIFQRCADMKVPVTVRPAGGGRRGGG